MSQTNPTTDITMSEKIQIEELHGKVEETGTTEMKKVEEILEEKKTKKKVYSSKNFKTYLNILLKKIKKGELGFTDEEIKDLNKNFNLRRKKEQILELERISIRKDTKEFLNNMICEFLKSIMNECKLYQNMTGRITLQLEDIKYVAASLYLKTPKEKDRQDLIKNIVEKEKKYDEILKTKLENKKNDLLQEEKKEGEEKKKKGNDKEKLLGLSFPITRLTKLIKSLEKTELTDYIEKYFPIKEKKNTEPSKDSEQKIESEQKMKIDEEEKAEEKTEEKTEEKAEEKTELTDYIEKYFPIKEKKNTKPSKDSEQKMKIDEEEKAEEKTEEKTEENKSVFNRVSEKFAMALSSILTDISVLLFKECIKISISKKCIRIIPHHVVEAVKSNSFLDLCFDSERLELELKNYEVSNTRKRDEKDEKSKNEPQKKKLKKEKKQNKKKDSNETKKKLKKNKPKISSIDVEQEKKNEYDDLSDESDF